MSKKTRFRPAIQTLENRCCLAGAAGVDIVTATPEEPARDFFAFDPAFTGGVFVGAADVNGETDAADEVAATQEEPQASTSIDGSNLSGNTANSEAGGIIPYPGFTGGVRVGAGDINGNAESDIVIGAGPGGGPHVKVFDGANPSAGPHVRVFDAVFTEIGNS